jgi:pyruvate kinase
MPLPTHKTKIVATIGPASESPETLERMIRAGMDVARLNFSHGDFHRHAGMIQEVRAAARRAGRRVAILGDLPGPKMRIGDLAGGPIELKPGDAYTLTAEAVPGDARRASVTYARLPQAVKPGDALFLDDGLIHLEVVRAQGSDVHCRVVVGGELKSRKGLNLPGIDLGACAFTERDHEWLRFAVAQGVDAVSQSFVGTAADVEAVRGAAAAAGGAPFIIAKIERAGALQHMDGILRAADGIMIARGDLGVETPIEEMAVVQKELIRKALLLGRPVITATQMLESMVAQRRPTRAEATDVANAILDGTDCIMLSGESAAGRFPVEAVAMLARIAEATEPHLPRERIRLGVERYGRDGTLSQVDLIALSVYTSVDRVAPAAVIVPTLSGATARNLARFRLPVWVVGVSPREGTCQALQFSSGVFPVHQPEQPGDWNRFARDWLRSQGAEGALAVLTEGPSPQHPNANHRMEIIDLTRMPTGETP